MPLVNRDSVVGLSITYQPSKYSDPSSPPVSAEHLTPTEEVCNVGGGPSGSRGMGLEKYYCIYRLLMIES